MAHVRLRLGGYVLCAGFALGCSTPGEGVSETVEALTTPDGTGIQESVTQQVVGIRGDLLVLSLSDRWTLDGFLSGTLRDEAIESVEITPHGIVGTSSGTATFEGNRGETGEFTGRFVEDLSGRLSGSFVFQFASDLLVRVDVVRASASQPARSTYWVLGR